MSLFDYLEALIPKIYKILPLKEMENKGEEVYVGRYLDNLAVKIAGARAAYPILCSVMEWADILNTLYYLRDNSCSHELCRRSVFDMIDMLKRIEIKVGEDYGV